MFVFALVPSTLTWVAVVSPFSLYPTTNFSGDFAGLFSGLFSMENGGNWQIIKSYSQLSSKQRKTLISKTLMTTMLEIDINSLISNESHTAGNFSQYLFVKIILSVLLVENDLFWIAFLMILKF